MSRLHLTKDQVNTLDRDTLSELLQEVNDELCTLANVERYIYTRRRELDIADDPTLMREPYPQPAPKIVVKPSTQSIIAALKIAGVDSATLKQFIK